jgi:hypothetical protein
MDRLKNLSSGSDDGEKNFCPLLNDPEPDCYCFNMNSHTISLAVKYCQGDYLACDIYLRYKKINGF